MGQLENEFTFMPDTANISVGDTVRWTWESDFHNVTSGTSCTADGQFVRPISCTVTRGSLTTQGSCMSSLLRSLVCISISAPCTASMG